MDRRDFRSLGLLLIVGLGLSMEGEQTSWARQDLVPGSRYTSARASAMGDSFLPFGEDGASALFYNPAVFGKIKGTHVEPANISTNFNEGFLKQAGFNSYKIISLPDYVSTLQQNQDTFGNLGVSIFPNFYMRGIGFGLLLQTQHGAQYSYDGTLSYRTLYQMIPTAGVGTAFGGGIIRIGYSLQWINEVSGSVVGASPTGTVGFSEGMQEGGALSHTLGAAFTLPYTYTPALNLVARNVLGTRYILPNLLPLGKNSNGKPGDQPMSVDASLSMSPRIGGPSFLNLSVTWRDVFGSSAMPLFGRLAAGMEIAIKDRIFLRAGWASGYPTAGVGLKSKTAELGVSWFSEEMGTGYQTLRDTKFLFQYQFRAF